MMLYESEEVAVNSAIKKCLQNPGRRVYVYSRHARISFDACEYTVGTCRPHMNVRKFTMRGRKVIFFNDSVILFRHVANHPKVVEFAEYDDWFWVGPLPPTQEERDKFNSRKKEVRHESACD